jgi:hypothetical protein
MPTLFVLFGVQVIFFMLNRLAMLFYRNKKGRRFGRAVYPFQSDFLNQLVAYIDEGYFDLCISLSL